MFGGMMKSPGDNPESRIIAISANTSWALTNYRMGLLKELQRAGFSIVALIPEDEGADRLREHGVQVRSVPIAAHGTSPIDDLRLLCRYFSLLRELKPRAFLGFTIKPNIYGSLAARLTGVPVINNVTGLGMVFTKPGSLRALVSVLYRLAFRKSHRIFFQNPESRELFVSRKIVDASQTVLLPGSGIDLDRFAPASTKRRSRTKFIFLLASRLIWQKGIGEYCEAARRLEAHYPDLEFQLLGSIERKPNKGAIPRDQIEEWQRNGLKYLGSADDVRPLLEEADCIVLPSYYPEGVPRVLIEAAAMGKPIITTDAPGCRDVVENEATGFLCEPMSVDSLVVAMTRMLALDSDVRTQMGSRARQKMEKEFDERIVHRAYLEAVGQLQQHMTPRQRA
jgi:glycosyltransferase involved in cell wall biosynthesis